MHDTRHIQAIIRYGNFRNMFREERLRLISLVFCFDLIFFRQVNLPNALIIKILLIKDSYDEIIRLHKLFLKKTVFGRSCRNRRGKELFRRALFWQWWSFHNWWRRRTILRCHWAEYFLCSQCWGRLLQGSSPRTVRRSPTLSLPSSTPWCPTSRPL